MATPGPRSQRGQIPVALEGQCVGTAQLGHGLIDRVELRPGRLPSLPDGGR